ncbi:SAM-dependent methyltransferase [Chitinophaga sp.]|uniref:SAM-dependent methyltransferase n=1 Tax=Chitinophaga sp. TaxID=1869181 RepID=UPI0031DBEBAE
MSKKGKLVVIGSGIKSIAHFTLESQAHLQQADIVLYAASDPVTDMWIQKQNPNSFDLYQYYGNTKNRIITYTQMIERIMLEVRAGKYVCALFYGHPGVFVTPSHNAIELARREGYEAEMLPGISAEDCLFADLGVDPSIPGLQTYEATDLLLRQRTINTEINAIVWQVGCVGDIGFKFHGYDNNKLNVLLDYLEKFYAPDQVVYNYVASMFSMANPKKDKYKLSDFRDPSIAREVTGISTFFIPAAKMTDSDTEMSKTLGLKSGKARSNPLICDHELYPAYKKVALKNIAEHTIPDGYKFSFSSDALYNLVSTLALNFEELYKYKENPITYLKSIDGLTQVERNMLNMQHYGALRMLFKRDRHEEAKLFVQDVLRNPELGSDYFEKQQLEYNALKTKTISESDYEARLVKWFQDKGYATTPSAVTEAVNGLVIEDELDFSGAYNCVLSDNEQQKPVSVKIDLASRTIQVDDELISTPYFGGDHILWSKSDKNHSTGVLTFSKETSGFNLKGKYSSNDTALPEAYNIIGTAETILH